jgi:hypothetical protein
VPIDNIPKEAKILTSTWAIKKKPNGVFRARIMARGYEQVKGIHYHEEETAAPAVLEATMNIVLIIMIIAKYTGEVMDAVGAFMNGVFNLDLLPIYMQVPEGFNKYYKNDSVRLMKKTLYNLVQAASMYWLVFSKVFNCMGYMMCEANPCLHFKWTNEGLNLWTTHVNDNLTVGTEKCVKEAKALMTEQFEWEDIGEMKEYLGCKIAYDQKNGCVQITQPILLQSLHDGCEENGQTFTNTPAIPNSVLSKETNDIHLEGKQAEKYRTLVGKLLYLTRSCPDICNAVRELTKFNKEPTENSMKALKWTIKYCIDT